MAEIKLNGGNTKTSGPLPCEGNAAPNAEFVNKDLKILSLKDFTERWAVLNVFPSLDTPVCAMSVRRFNTEAASLPDAVVLCISADLPFAHKRFCETEGIENVENLSVFRNPEFGELYGLTIASGPLAGLLARAVLVIDPFGKIAYTQLVPEITEEPDYEDVLQFMKSR